MHTFKYENWLIGLGITIKALGIALVLGFTSLLLGQNYVSFHV